MRGWSPAALLAGLVLLVPVYGHPESAMRSRQIVGLAADRMMDPGLWEVYFAHRFTTPIADADLNNLYGLDSFAHTGLGLAVGLHDRVSVGLYRTALEKNFELWTRIGLLTDPEGPLHVSLRTSLNFNTDAATNDPLRLGILLVAGLRFGRVTLDLVPALVTRPARDDRTTEATLALGLGAGVAVTDALSLVAEVVPVVSGYRLRDADGRAHATWGVGLQIEVGGHVFTLLVTNQIGTTVDRVLPGADVARPRLGFNLVRRF